MKLQIGKNKAKGQDSKGGPIPQHALKKKMVRINQLLGPHESYMTLVNMNNEPVYGLRAPNILTLDAVQTYLLNKEIHVVQVSDGLYRVVRGIRYWQLLVTADRKGVKDEHISIEVGLIENWNDSEIHHAAHCELLLEQLVSGLTNGGQRILVDLYADMRADHGSKQILKKWFRNVPTKKGFSSAIGVRYETFIEQDLRDRKSIADAQQQECVHSSERADHES